MNRRLAGLLALAGLITCGCYAIPAPLPNAVPGLTLDTVEQIQNDPSLTPDEAAEILRSFLGVEDNDAGNLLVNFLLSLNIPPKVDPADTPTFSG